MAFYVIAAKDAEDLETVVFESEVGDAIMFFTDSGLARNYVDEAGWQDSHTVATLESIDFLEWLMKCYRDGVRTMATDPKRSDQDSGLRVNTLDLEAHLTHAGDHIHQVARPGF